MGDSEKKKIALLTNITADLIAARLRKKYDFYLPEGFDTWVQEAINPDSGLYRVNADAIILLLDCTEARAWKNIDEAYDHLSVWKQGLAGLLDHIKDTPIFVSTIDMRDNRIRSLSERIYAPELENDWYQFVRQCSETNDYLYILDLKDMISDIGRRSFYSDKMWYVSNMPYSREGLIAVVREIDRVLDSLFKSRKKIIALDLDNTLWGGVIGEDGMEGIELSDHKEGQRFYDFQRQLLEMKKRGVLLALNSKNNQEDAEEAIQNHPDMLLRDADFAIRKINWDDKAANLKSMEEELNITESGFIFVDDNPVEREIVKGECPEVTVPGFPEDTTKLLSFAEEIWADYCRPLRVLDEDANKTRMYQSESKRKQELKNSLNLEDYIARLEIEVEIHSVKPDELQRAAQLCGKTNQFNLTTKRYSVKDIADLSQRDDCRVYVVYSRDKYGDSGLIAAVILLKKEETVYIDTFLMSCRVMGRMLEHVIINEIAAQYSDSEKLVGEYVPTAKNVPVKDLYERLGFETIWEQDGHKKYQMNIHDYEKKAFDIYKKISFEA